MRRFLAVVVVLILVAVACGNEESGGGGGSGSGRPGVTDDTIRVGGVVGKTNPVGRPYTDGFVGAEAYFDMVNDQGGVFGRDIELVAKRDDQSRASQNLTQVRALVEEDNVFAVIPVVTQIFAGARYLADTGVPTFGWNINAEWSSGPNLFGEKGSFLCFTCPIIQPSYIAQQVGTTAAAVFAYGSSTQSVDCAEGTRNGFETYGVPVPVVDTSLALGAIDISASIDRIREQNVDFIATCMDINGTAAIAKALDDAGIEGVDVYSPEGYSDQVLEDLGDQVEGFYFQMVFTPFELPDPPKALQQFLDAMEERDKVPSEQGLAGWIDAILLVEGIKAAGKNFTQQKVVDAINEMENFTAKGILVGVPWTRAHAADPTAPGCVAYVQVQDGEFVPVFGQPGQPFVCFELNEVAQTGPPNLDNPIFK